MKSEIWPNINNSTRDIRSPLNPNEWLRFTHAHARTINWPSAQIIWGLNIQQWVSYLNHIPSPSSLLVSFSRDYLNYTFWSANWLNNQDKIRLRRSARPHRMHWWSDMRIFFKFQTTLIIFINTVFRHSQFSNLNIEACEKKKKKIIYENNAFEDLI